MHEGKNKVRLYALLAAAALIAVGGCLPANTRHQWSPVENTASEGDVSLYRDVAFSDIPVPIEFDLIPSESYSFQGAHFRTGVFHYAGQVGYTWALQYFRTEMPANGWVLEKTDRGFADRTLTFSKGPERLIVVIRQIRGGSRVELQLDNIAQNDLLLKGKLKSD